jgi:2-dehydro-3-deoxygluconokinase
MPRFDVTTLGEAILRYSVPAGQRLEKADRFDVHVGGTEANVATLLARLGWNCGWVSALPKNPLGRRVVNEFSSSGLDLSAVTWSDQHRLAVYYVEFSVPPRPTQVYFDRAGTCFANLTPSDIDWDYLLDTRLLHLCGLTAALSDGAHEIIVEALHRARARGVLVSLDVNYRVRLWSGRQARHALEPIVRAVDLLFCSRTDAERVFEITGSPERIVQQLGEYTDAGDIITSLSSEGILGWDRTHFYHQPAYPVTVLDRIGAGDAMVAGVLHGWLGGDFVRGLRYGALTAAMALSQYGDQVITNLDELDGLLNQRDLDIQR